MRWRVTRVCRPGAPGPRSPHAQTAVIEVWSDLRVLLDIAAVDVDGSLVTLLGAEGPLADRVAPQPLLAVVRAATMSPVPGPNRLLDRVTVHGSVGSSRTSGSRWGSCSPRTRNESVLRPDASALLRVTVGHVRVDGELSTSAPMPAPSPTRSPRAATSRSSPAAGASRPRRGAPVA